MEPMGKMSLGAIVVAFVLITLGLVYLLSATPGQRKTVTNMISDSDSEKLSFEHDAPERQVVDDAPVDVEVTELDYDFEGMLYDVSGGGASGRVGTFYVGNKFYLQATFEALDDPTSYGEGYFYEGWIVRQNPLSIVSTGVIDFTDGKATNLFETSVDLLDHRTYVLTIEPNDGNPAPGDHILEAVLR